VGGRRTLTESGCFCDLTRFDAAGTDSHATVAALRLLNPNGLQIGIENARRTIIGVRDIIAKLRALAANFTTLCHDYLILLSVRAITQCGSA
jgi:hypothetical protein